MGRTFPTSVATPVLLGTFIRSPGKVRPFPSLSTDFKHCSAIVAGLYWRLRRSVLRDEQAYVNGSNVELKRGGPGAASRRRAALEGTTTAASTTPAATAPGAAEVATTAAATERARAASGELPALRAPNRFWQRFGVRDARTDGALGQWARRLGMATLALRHAQHGGFVRPNPRPAVERLQQMVVPSTRRTLCSARFMRPKFDPIPGLHRRHVLGDALRAER